MLGHCLAGLLRYNRHQPEMNFRLRFRFATTIKDQVQWVARQSRYGWHSAEACKQCVTHAGPGLAFRHLIDTMFPNLQCVHRASSGHITITFLRSRCPAPRLSHCLIVFAERLQMQFAFFFHCSPANALTNDRRCVDSSLVESTQHQTVPESARVPL